MLRYTECHEWVRVEGDVATVGLTPFVQEKLGELVYVELPGAGTQLRRGALAATIESVKAVSEVYAPLAGEVLQANEKLARTPELVNADPTGEGWLFKMKMADAAELAALMDEEAYKALTAAQNSR